MGRFALEFNRAVGMYAKAIQFINQQKVWHWFALPFLLNGLLFAISLYFSWQYSAKWATGLLEWLQVKNGDWNAILKWAFLIGFRILTFLAYAFVYKYLVFLLMSPVLAWISERVSARLYDREFEFNFIQLLSDTWRGIKLSFRNLFFELFFTIILLLLAFIPFVGLLSPLFILLIQAYYYGFQMLDYNCERYRINSRNALAYMKRHKALALGNGLMFYALFLLPIVGWMVAPILGAIAATLAFESTHDPLRTANSQTHTLS